MVQIYNKNRVIQDRYCQVLKTKKVRNPLSFTPFPMDVYRCLSILTLLPQNQHDIPISNLRTRVANITQTRK